MQRLFNVILLCTACPPVFANTGTFLDRYDANDLRVVSYNVYVNAIFPEVDASQAAKFERVVQALDPDVLNLQEIYSFSATEVASLMDSIAPLGGGAHWHAHQGGDNVIVSKFPLSLTATNTRPSARQTGIALVELPEERFAADLYVMNSHFKCCNTSEPPSPLDAFELQRQYEADALVNWMRDARTPAGHVDLPIGVPMLVAGDLNIINEPDVLDPLGTLVTGDIYHEDVFGQDSAPDWDGTSLQDVRPRHNGAGLEDYTWRNDVSPFEPGRLDYLLFTDSVAQMGNRFVLNTATMTPQQRAATGLMEYDVTLDDVGLTYDHLPLVVDLRKIGEAMMPGDYNDDRRVDALDYAVWRQAVGGPAGTLTNDPTNLPVGPQQYEMWLANYGAVLPLPARIATPEPGACLLLLAASLVVASGRPQRTARRPG